MLCSFKSLSINIQRRFLSTPSTILLVSVTTEVESLMTRTGDSWLSPLNNTTTLILSKMRITSSLPQVNTSLQSIQTGKAILITSQLFHSSPIQRSMASMRMLPSPRIRTRQTSLSRPSSSPNPALEEEAAAVVTSSSTSWPTLSLLRYPALSMYQLLRRNIQSCTSKV